VKLRHFEQLQPICPLCQKTQGLEHPLAIGRVIAAEGDDVIEGVIVCTGCQREYPILDAIPLLVPALRAYVAQNAFQLTLRGDLSETVESILGDCCGPGSPLDQTRQYLSSYTWGHYADLDPEESPPVSTPHVLRVLEQGLALAGEIGDGPILDAGCSVGRTSFALAERFPDRLVIGVDLSFSMAQLASRVLRRGEVRYPRRRVGLVYDRRVFPARFAGADRVDYWICDARSLPFRTGTFALASSLNLLDCVTSPHEHLTALGRVLAPGSSRAIIATPYDWSAGATPIEGWIGGHSQRGPERGDSAAALRALLTPGAHPASIASLSLVGEAPSQPWTVRVHDRSTMEYAVHVVAARGTGAIA
jgi:SAM-dependent methyltransferase